jgi:ABC-type nitrate/sulfonate/bicarbonate transport system permease component
MLLKVPRLNGVFVGIFTGRKTRKGLSPILRVFASDRVLWISSPILILILWEGITRLGSVPSFILPTPSDIFQALFHLITSGELLPHIGYSLFRALSGFVIGSTAGILLGLMMGWSRIINNIADIPFNVFRAVPKAALVPVFIIWFGIGEFPKVLLLALTVFVLCTVNTIAGVRSVDITMIKAARSLGSKDRDILWEVIIPAAMPMIFAALRLGVVSSLIMLVIAEITAADKGLGVFIMDSQRFFYTDRMFAGILTLAVFAYTLDRIVRRVEARVLRWHKGVIAAGG